MKKDNKELRQFFLKLIKELNENSKETTVEPDIKTKPETTPAPARRRKLVPDEWPEEAPGPKPKAESVIKEIKKNTEFLKYKSLIIEKKYIQKEMSMDIKDPSFGLPHKNVIDGIEGYETTPYDDLPFFHGGILDYSTLEKIGSEEFNKIIKDIKPFGKLEYHEIEKIFNIIKEIESKYIPQLEELAIKKVKQQFGLPDEVSDKLVAKLVKKVKKPNEDTDNLVKKVETNLEFTEKEKEIIKIHSEKRIIQNALMMGAGFRSHSIFNSIKNDLDALDPKLFLLYERVMPNVALFMWQYPFEKNMGNVKMMGLSKIKKNNNGKIEAEAVATIFPILLHETAKAAIELLFANYIISLTKKYGANVAGEIIRKSDVFENEIWHKRIGPTLWKYLHDVIDYVIIHEKESNYTLVSYLLHDISMMEPNDFIKFMNIIIYNGDKSTQMISKMIDDIEFDLENEKNLNNQTDESNLVNIVKSANQELNNLSHIAKEKKESIIKKIDFKDMSIDQLKDELKKSLGEERYEDASKITKIIKSKMNF